jgi:hypothetical protein
VRIATAAIGAVLITLTLSLAAGCGGAGSSPTAPEDVSGSLAFTASPIDPALIQYIVPLGQMGPWAHTFPTDHAYIYHHLGASSFAPVTVFAPAAGTVNNTYPGQNGESKVWVKVNGRYSYYFDHVQLAGGLGVGAKVEAGAVIGVSAGIAFDFAVTDMATSQGFITPARYGTDSVYAQSPFPFFVEPIRSTLYSRVQRVGADLDGKINFDVAGTLSGNWFDDTLPVAGSTSNDITIGQRQIAFARDVRFPDRLRVSVGGFGMTGLYGVPPGAPDFTAVTPASGLVIYRLLNTGEPGGPAGVDQLGLLLVQLIDGGHLRVEVVNDRQSATASFSGQARNYIR